MRAAAFVLLALLVVVPVAASAQEAPEQPCQRPWFEAYDCWFGQVGAQQVTVCGKNYGSFCVSVW